MTMRTAKVWAAWVFLAAMLIGSAWDAATNKTEPFHVLMLSWGAMDIASVQVLLATLTRREIKDDKS